MFTSPLLLCFVFFLMRPQPPRYTRTDTPFPYTPLSLSRPANTHVQDVSYRTKSFGLHCIDQSAHAVVQRLGVGNTFVVAFPSFGRVFRRASFGHIDGFALKQSLTRLSQIGSVGEIDKQVDKSLRVRKSTRLKSST